MEQAFIPIVALGTVVEELVAPLVDAIQIVFETEGTSFELTQNGVRRLGRLDITRDFVETQIPGIVIRKTRLKALN